MNVLLLGPHSEERLRSVREQLGPDWTVTVWERGDAEDARTTCLAEADAVVTMSWRAGGAPAPRLRLIQLPGAGFDRIEFDAVPARCTVCNVFEHEIGIAEHVVLGVLESEIHLAHQDAALRRGEWADGFARDRPLHGELYGKTVGFIGYGHIARATAQRLRPFGVRIVARTRSPQRGDDAVDEIAGMDRLDELLAACHYVVVTCPLTEATRGLFDRRAFATMRSDAVLVNVARGEVVDEDALFEACRDQVVRGAVIDTWYRYPREDGPCFPSRHPFQDLDNVIMSPHSSGWSAGLLDRRWKVMCENLRRLAVDEPLLNVLRAPGGPGPE